MHSIERRHGNYVISTDPERFDVDVFHEYLTTDAYWARGRLRATTDIAVQHSLLFGAYAPDGAMVGAARVVTDHATFGWICDLFVLPEHRGNGLGKALVAAITEHPELCRLKRLLLVTADAHGLYTGNGFETLRSPERWLERNGPTT